jgi:hypothetical protein
MFRAFRGRLGFGVFNYRLNRIAHDVPSNDDFTVLPYSMNPIHSLCLYHRIPLWLEHVDVVGDFEVDAKRARNNPGSSVSETLKQSRIPFQVVLPFTRSADTGKHYHAIRIVCKLCDGLGSVVKARVSIYSLKHKSSCLKS